MVDLNAFWLIYFGILIISISITLPTWNYCTEIFVGITAKNKKLYTFAN